MKFLYQDHANKSGIYKIVNTHTNRIYIGQCKSFKQRWYGHKQSLIKNKHQNKFIQNDYNKCLLELGNDDFLEFHVLEVMENSTKEERNLKEEFYVASLFDKQQLCYNFHEKTKSKERSCYSNTPEETFLKKSTSAKRMWESEEYKKNQSEVQKQRTTELWQNEEYRQKHVESITKAVQSEETRRNMARRWQDAELRKELGEKSKERWQSEEYRQKHLLEMKKRWSSEEYCINHSRKMKKYWENNETQRARASQRMKEKMAEKYANQKVYELIDPSGNLVKITNLKEFCKNSEVKLIPQCLKNVFYHKKHYYKGWTAIGSNIDEVKENFKETISKWRRKNFVFINPSGEETIILDLKKYCKNNDLSYDAMLKVNSKKQESHNGWIAKQLTHKLKQLPNNS